MEIFPYIFSVLLTALVIHWSRVNAAVKPGTQLTGLFRYRDIKLRPKPPASACAAAKTAALRR